MTLEIALMIVGFLIVIVGSVSGITSIWLIVKYFRFNRRENSLGLTGMQIARKILDDNGLEHIKVKRTGSLLFGNSYSHYFKKVRLRGLIRHETSLTSMGMGAQKAALAILDKEGDEPFAITNATGCFIFFRTSVFMELGGFDERFFMYLEDCDIARRTAEKYKALHIPTVTVYHLWERESKRNYKLLMIHVQSILKYFLKWGLKF